MLVVAGVLFGGCQCLGPVKDCSLEDCDGGQATHAPRTRVDGGSPIDLYVQRVFCEQRKLCGALSADANCDDQIWGLRINGYDWNLFLDLVDAGVIKADQANIETCLAQFETTCAPDCWPPYRGTINLGEPCANSVGCKAGLYCEWASCTCVRQLSAGAETDDVNACASTIYVNLPDGTLLCDDVVPLGGSCEPLPRAPGLRTCVKGAGCGLGSDGLHSCVELAAAGEECVPGGCDHGLACVAGACVARAALNQACSTDQQSSQLPPCYEDFDCKNGVCARPSGVEGDTCSQTERCAPPFACRTGSKCVRISDTGGPCASSFDCGDWMDSCQNGTCQPRKTVGSACSQPGDCLAGNTCRSGVCDALTCTAQ